MLATFIFDLVLGLRVTTLTSSSSPSATPSLIANNSKLISMDKKESSRSIGDDEVQRDRIKPVLALLSDLYFKLDSISINISGPFSYPISYCLLTT